MNNAVTFTFTKTITWVEVCAFTQKFTQLHYLGEEFTPRQDMAYVATNSIGGRDWRGTPSFEAEAPMDGEFLGFTDDGVEFLWFASASSGAEAEFTKNINGRWTVVYKEFGEPSGYSRCLGDHKKLTAFDLEEMRKVFPASTPTPAWFAEQTLEAQRAILNHLDEAYHKLRVFEREINQSNRDAARELLDGKSSFKERHRRIQEEQPQEDWFVEAE